MRADRSSSTIKRNNMELGKHVQLTLVSFEQQMLPTCRRLLFPCARGSRAIKEIGDANAIVCLSCFLLFVCLFAFWYRFLLFSPLSNREHGAAKENIILGYASRNRKIRYASLKENEGQICLKPVKTMTCSRFEEVHLQCTAPGPVRIGIIRIQRFGFLETITSKIKYV